MAYDPAIKEQFFKFLAGGIGVGEASKRLGINKRTGIRWKQAGPAVETKEAYRNITRMQKVPDPIPYDKLTGLAQDMIAPDGYPLFAEKVFGFRPVPWQIKAAKISVEAVLDDTERHYGIANEPPGAGKSTIWTLSIPAWLLCGGGRADPAWGRSLRFMFGHASKGVSEHYVTRFARLIDSPRPYYDKQARTYGEVTLAKEYGRFRSLQSVGDVTLWQNKQITVAQLEDVDLSDKEPTCQAASPKAEFVGERCEYASWDDLVTDKLSRNIDQVKILSSWFQNEAEQRIEPGGILWLVGQRISSIDLFRDRLNAEWIDEDGTVKRKYFHIVFPVHHEPTCDVMNKVDGGVHRQWDAEPDGDGCLLDSIRLPWKDVLKHASNPNYRTIFQQEDTDPSTTLVTRLMIDGGRGVEFDPADGLPYEVEYPGNWDHERGFGDFPVDTYRSLINYVTVDPSVTGNWSIQWWATTGLEDVRYLIYGWRLRMQAGDLLDWDEHEGHFVGIMERTQGASLAANQVIRCWIIEANAAFKHLFMYRHFRRWKDRWPFVEVIPHQTQKNKADEVMGVEVLLRNKYRRGLASLPRKSGDMKALTFTNSLVHELTTYPKGGTDDNVMSDWFGEANMDTILRVGRRPLRRFEVESQLPEYLVRQRREIARR